LYIHVGEIRLIAWHLNETEVFTSNISPHRHASSSFNLALEYAISMVQENKKGLESNRTHTLLIYNDVNLLDKSEVS
jgi:hypothetical protein